MKNIYLLTTKKLAFCLALTISAFSAQAQVGIGTTTPDPSAQLDIQAERKGVLMPRMLGSERALIQNPAAGLLVYQTDAPTGFYYFDGTAWMQLQSESGGTIIPFAAASPITITSTVGGIIGSNVAVGNGSSLTFPLAPIPFGNNVAAIVPRAGNISSISGSFTSNSFVDVSVAGAASAVITIQLFAAVEGSSIYSAVPGASASVTLPNILVPLTEITATNSNLNIPVSAGTRLILSYSAPFNDAIAPVQLVGQASAAINVR